MKRIILTSLILMALGSFVLPAAAQDATELMKAAHLKMYYPADDGTANVSMVITDKRGRTRVREFTILRKDFEEGGEQRYYIYFSAPNDVRRTTFMAWKNPTDDDSRWIYVPALDLVKPISANDKKSSFVGSDFAYEDVSGRHWSDDSHTHQGVEAMGEWTCDKIESVPNGKDYFARKLSWIDQASGLVVREEYYDKKDKQLKIFEVLEIQDIQGIPTATERKMSTPKKENFTVISFADPKYDVGLTKDIFSERYLKSPPSQFIN
ncbi:outer membrane lipoprotein-sorting protein [bacterium]|nr:MAG: outer membrane lipoprotein-sorting protein [bacterium]